MGNEAAHEVPRQLRLRDIGGIIVVDFIDMEIEANKRAVLHEIRKGYRIQKFGFGPTPVQSVTWGSMKSRYRGERGAAQPAPQDR